MLIKYKSCKGINKAAGHGCGTMSLNRHYGLCPKCYAKWLCCTLEGSEKLKKTVISAKKKTKQAIKKEDKKRKVDLMSIRALIIAAKVPFQKLIRIRDHGKNCISCNKPLPFNIGHYDAGHLFSADRYSGVIFNEFNVAGQCVHCNRDLHGNEAEYKKGLDLRHGEGTFERLHEIANLSKNFKYDRQYLIDLEKFYKSELKKVENREIEVDEINFNYDG